MALERPSTDGHVLILEFSCDHGLVPPLLWACFSTCHLSQLVASANVAIATEEPTPSFYSILIQIYRETFKWVYGSTFLDVHFMNLKTDLVFLVRIFISTGVLEF